MKNDNCEITRIDGVVVDITSRKMIEDTLHRSEQRYKSLFQYHNDTILELDLDGTIISMNQAAEIAYGEGYVAEGHKIWTEFLGAEGVRRAAEYFQMAKDGRPQQFEISSTDINGNVQNWDVKKIPIYVNGEITGVFAIGTDITSKRKIDRKLQESEERYRRLIELSPQPIASMRDGKLIFINAAGLKLLGAGSVSELIGKSIFDFVHPEYVQMAQDRAELVRMNKFIGTSEYKLVRMDGQTIEAEVSGIFDDQMQSTLMVINDVTVRNKMERALQESEERYRQMVELSPISIVVYKDRKLTYVNPAGLKLIGVKELDGIIGINPLKFVHPDDSGFARKRMEQSLRGLCSPEEYRIIRMDGKTVDVSVTSIYDVKTLSVQLVLVDVSARKQAEQALLKSEEMNRLLVELSDRFSSDLFGVLKVHELEQRLIKEVRDVIKASKVSLIEVERNNRFFIRCGHHIPERLPSSLFEWNQNILPVCEIVDMPDGHIIKLGEIRGKMYLLCICEKPQTLTLPSYRIWLETICRYVSVLYDNFRVIEDLTKELEEITTHQATPSWLLRLLFKLSEHERKRLSQDLHDAALQEQIIWYRKLDQLISNQSLPAKLQEQLEQITQGLLDVVYQIRITCNELRPPMLKEEGIVSSLEALFEFTQLRSNYSIEFSAFDIPLTLTDDQITGLYRIVQELLANASKHSNATRVHIFLTSGPDWIQLNYEDNGIGMDISKVENTFVSMGVYGMKERVRSMNGTIEFRSSPDKGLAICICIPASNEILTI
ncbi:PAS domain S-box protein [Cohnella luojiensis]|uniref:histidine kinase n=2 Tax=Cohnella luojiensis TaxID=652876 RepID=A0A4Y8LWZ4_9BACL|nr:PAS domain S-box protein [Cohnella luojiensis]